MDSSANNIGLPASRTDALSLVVLGLFNALIGATPHKDKKLAIAFTILANIWAIASSVLTFREVYDNPHELETHLWLFLVGLLVLTIGTSTLVLIAFWVTDDNEGIAFLIGMVVVVSVFVFGLVVLVLAYAKGCDENDFAESALCKHTTGYVVGAVVGAFVSGGVGGVFIVVFTVGGPSGVVQNVWKAMNDTATTGDEDAHLAIAGAWLTRVSAFAKVCLLGVYWFLVDPDLCWDWTFTGYDTSWWVTGQWAKQGVSIANNLLNNLSC